MAKPLDQESVAAGLQAINAIAPNEIKYYLLLTLKAISKEDTPQNRLILAELIELSKVLSDFLDPQISSPKQIEQIRAHYQNLADLSGAYTLGVEVGYALIQLGSVLTGFIAGVLGAVVGGVAGLLRAVCTFNNPLYFLADGFFTGMAVGGAIGFRTPKKLFKNEFTRQLRFALDGIDECIGNITERVNRPFSQLLQQEIDAIWSKNFKKNDQAFQQFLDSDTSYRIATVSAQFLSDNLDGFLGQHARIIIDIPNQERQTLLEFGPESDEIDQRPLMQVEERTVTGRKLIEMIALHKHLWQTEECTMSYAFTKMKGGDNDCHSYINKILIGTNQDAATCQRFNGSENWVGRNIIGFFVKKLSPFPQDIFDNPVAECEM